MNNFLKLMKCFQLYLIGLGTLILLDMFIFKGKLKYLYKVIANTTSTSPFSTDGQSNYILILVIIAVVIAIYILFKILEKPIAPPIEPEDKEKQENKITKI